jgi:Tol biopolymer transport system component
MKRYLPFFLALLIAACTVAIPVSPAPAGGSAQRTPTPAQGSNGAATVLAPTGLPWAGLGLAGRLVLILRDREGYVVTHLDLASGVITPLYHAEPGVLISSALVSPDGKQILLTYAPPATAQNQVAYTSLYLMPGDGSKPPQPIFARASQTDAYYAPTWAPDGKSLYASHFKKGSDPSGADFRYSIDRVTLDGQAQEVIPNGQWPRLSPDGLHISYVTIYPNNPVNDLYQADLDGKNAAALLKPGEFPAVDDHFYTPDGKTMIFSAVNQPKTSARTPWERWLGGRVASAHNIPSDWYSVPAAGGETRRLTNLENTGMYAALSPDRQWIAFISANGIYVMRLDGSRLTQLNGLLATGTVDWVP